MNNYNEMLLNNLNKLYEDGEVSYIFYFFNKTFNFNVNQMLSALFIYILFVVILGIAFLFWSRTKSFKLYLFKSTTLNSKDIFAIFFALNSLLISVFSTIVTNNNNVFFSYDDILNSSYVKKLKEKNIEEYRLFNDYLIVNLVQKTNKQNKIENFIQMNNLIYFRKNIEENKKEIMKKNTEEVKEFIQYKNDLLNHKN